MEGVIEKPFGLAQELVNLRELADHYRKQRDAISAKLMQVEKGQDTEERKKIKKDWRSVAVWREMWIDEATKTNELELLLHMARSELEMERRKNVALDQMITSLKKEKELQVTHYTRSQDFIAELMLVIEAKDEQLDNQRKRLRVTTIHPTDWPEEYSCNCEWVGGCEKCKI